MGKRYRVRDNQQNTDIADKVARRKILRIKKKMISSYLSSAEMLAIVCFESLQTNRTALKLFMALLEEKYPR